MCDTCRSLNTFKYLFVNILNLCLIITNEIKQLDWRDNFKCLPNRSYNLGKTYSLDYLLYDLIYYAGFIAIFEPSISKIAHGFSTFRNKMPYTSCMTPNVPSSKPTKAPIISEITKFRINLHNL